MNRRPTVLGLGIAVVLLLPTVLGARPDQTAARPEARHVDPAAVAVLQAMDDAFTGAQGLVATYRSETFRPNGQPAPGETVSLRLGRPNVFEVRSTSGTGTRERILASNGTKRFDVMTGTPARCVVSDVTPLNDAREIDTFNPVYWSFYSLGEWQIRSALLGHWATKWRLNDPGLRSVRYVGRDTVATVPVDVVEWTYTIGYNRPDDDPVYTSRLSIGLDHFVRRIETTSTSKKEYEGRRIVETVTEIKATALQPAKAFAYSPPAGVACAPVNQEDVYTTGKFADLPMGSTAPDFTLKTARGETLRFSTFLKQHKVVLMNYWGYG